MEVLVRMGATTYTMPSEREIVGRRVFDAPREMVFEAWTSYEHVPHWMLGPEGWTMPVCEIDLRVGGGWRFVWRKADRSEMEMDGAGDGDRDDRRDGPELRPSGRASATEWRSRRRFLAPYVVSEFHGATGAFDVLGIGGVVTYDGWGAKLPMSGREALETGRDSGPPAARGHDEAPELSARRRPPSRRWPAGWERPPRRGRSAARRPAPARAPPGAR